MRKEDEQAMRRTLALFKIKCQEQKECPKCPLYKDVKIGNYEHHGCVLDMPPSYVDIDTVVKCFM